jgi:hypothetical protein
LVQSSYREQSLNPVTAFVVVGHNPCLVGNRKYLGNTRQWRRFPRIQVCKKPSGEHIKANGFLPVEGLKPIEYGNTGKLFTNLYVLGFQKYRGLACFIF